MIPKQTPVRNFRPVAPAPPAASHLLFHEICRRKSALCFLVFFSRHTVAGKPYTAKMPCAAGKVLCASLSSSPDIPFPGNRTRQKCLVPQEECFLLPCLLLPAYRSRETVHGKNSRKKREARFGASLRSVSGGIRTRDLQSRSLTRYPAALQTQSTLLLYLVLRRRARPSFIPACSACAPPVSRSAPRRRAAPPPPSPGSRGRCGGAAPLPCGRGVSLPPRS